MIRLQRACIEGHAITIRQLNTTPPTWSVCVQDASRGYITWDRDSSPYGIYDSEEDARNAGRHQAARDFKAEIQWEPSSS